MIIQLQAEYLSRFDGRYIGRKLKLLKMRTRRLVRTKIRKVRSASLAWYRQQYFLSTAYGDMKGSISRNEDIFIAVSVIAATLGYAYAVIASELFYAFFMTAFSLSEAMDVSIIAVTSVATCSLAVTLAWVTAFMFNSMSLAIMHGANRKKVRSLRSTLRQGLRCASRTTISWLVFLAAVLLPVAGLGIAAFIHFWFYVATPIQALEIIPYYIIAAIASVIYMVLQYSLMPMVAFFEPGLGYREAFMRSKELITRKGRIFILYGYCILATALIAEYTLAAALDNLIGLNKNLAFGLMAIVTAVYANGIMTVFYRKRRLARNR